MALIHTKSFRSAPFAILLLFLGTGCGHLQAHPPFQVNTLYQVESQHPLPLETFLSELLTADVIFIGEEHYTPSHIEAALTVLDHLRTHKRRPTLAMEMFGWDGQAGLDRYINQPDMSVPQFLEESRWKDNWGGDYSDYEPLISYARTHHIPVLGLNPPRPLVRLVAKNGLETAMKDAAFSKWGMGEIVTDDPQYEHLLFEQIKACHPSLPDHVYPRFLEASIIRDEGMATVIRNYLDQKSPADGPLVTYTGGGHIQYGIPVPKRVARTHPGFKAVTIYLETWDPSKAEEIQAELNDGIADYLWLTPLGPKGLQPKCG